MTQLRNKQVGGDHYCAHKIQPLDVIDEYQLSYRLGNAVKYILRTKGQLRARGRVAKKVEDLRKACHYIEMEIERLEKD